jgi:hypothetical protein
MPSFIRCCESLLGSGKECRDEERRSASRRKLNLWLEEVEPLVGERRNASSAKGIEYIEKRPGNRKFHTAV